MNKKPPRDLSRRSPTRKILIATTLVIGSVGCGAAHHPHVGTPACGGSACGIAVVQSADQVCTAAQLRDFTTVKCCDTPESGALNQSACTSGQRDQLTVGVDRCCPTARDAAPKVGVAPTNPPAEAACTATQLHEQPVIQCCEVPDVSALNQSQCTSDQESSLQAGFNRCCPPKVSS